MKYLFYKYIFLIFLLVNYSFSANHYIRAGANGSNNGSDWNDAWTALPQSLVRGDKYYIADGDYPSYTFNDAVSGSDSIFVVKATAFAHGTDIGWQSIYGDGVSVFNAPITFGSDNWVFDGIVGSDTSGHGIKVQATGDGKIIQLLTGGTVSNIAIRHVEMEHQAAPGNGDDIFYANTSGSNNINLSYCYLHDCGRAPVLLRNVDNFTLEYSVIQRSHYHVTQHSEGISSIGGDDAIIRHNKWIDIPGTGIIIFYGDGWELYGNLFYFTGWNPPGVTMMITNGAIGTWTATPTTLTNSEIYNNTFVDLVGINTGLGGNASSSGNEAYNNLFYNCENMTIHTSYTHDYNWFYDSGSHSEPHIQYGSNDIFINYSTYNFHISNGTDNGKDDLGSPFNTDIDGNIRGSDGIWDRGGYEFSGNNPSKPQGLVIRKINNSK